jgi:hypothetical protein
MLLVDNSGGSLHRKNYEARMYNKMIRNELESTKLSNITLRMMIKDAYVALLWILDFMAASQKSRKTNSLFKEIHSKPDILRGIGTLCIMVAIVGCIVYELF